MVEHTDSRIAGMRRPGWLRRTLTYFLHNWERILFGVVGAACLTLTFRFLIAGQIAAGSALFGMAFFSFFYSNLARFKRFKGLGFEAELWEDKQKEAADLIDRLKSIVSVYTREIVMNNVMRGRWGGSDKWDKRWELFDDLTGKHTELGQEIDFAPLKHEMDSVFIFDICSPLASSARRTIEKAKASVSEQLHKKYGPVITDLEGWNADIAKLREVHTATHDLFARAHENNIAQEILDQAESARARLADNFSAALEFDPIVLPRLRAMSEKIKHRPLKVTPELLEWTEWRDTPT